MGQDNLIAFVGKLPKVELHAHLNGSISLDTIRKLVKIKKRNEPDWSKEAEDKIKHIIEADRDIESVFDLFIIIQQLTTSVEAVKLATIETIREFAEDGVRYLELRTTPRGVDSRMSKREYVQAVLEGIEASKTLPMPSIVTKLLLSIDRRRGLLEAEDTVSLIEELKYCPLIVGVDLSGDTRHSSEPYLPLLKRIRDEGRLKLSIHLAETKDELKEVGHLLALPPDRIGHGTFLRPEEGGQQEFVDIVERHLIPIG